MLFGKMLSMPNMGYIARVGGARGARTLIGWIFGILFLLVEHFKSLVRFEVENGSRVLFWHDLWGFPFRATLLEEAMVKDVVSWNCDQSHCNITFSRSPFIGKRKAFAIFCFACQFREFERICEILVLYDFKSSFTINSFVQRSHDGRNQPNFCIEAIWKSKAPIKAYFCA